MMVILDSAVYYLQNNITVLMLGDLYDVTW